MSDKKKGKCKFNVEHRECLHDHVSEAHDKVLDNSRSNWNMEMLVFEERGKPEYPEKILLEQGREPTTNSTQTRDTLVGGKHSPLCHPYSD